MTALSGATEEQAQTPLQSVPVPDGAARPHESAGRGKTGSVIFWPLIPRTAPPSDYDIRNLATYVRLLVAESNGAGEREVARDVFLRVTPSDRLAGMAARSHLERAHWLFENKFLPLMWAIDD